MRALKGCDLVPHILVATMLRVGDAVQLSDCRIVLHKIKICFEFSVLLSCTSVVGDSVVTDFV